ncbi:MAG: metallophosphoesterase [Candidatus Thorarchaeota archaeon]
MREIRGWNPIRIHEELKLEPRQIADAWSAKASDYAYELSTGVSVGETDQTGKMEDIINLFQNRLEVIEKILKNEHGFHKFGDIREVDRNRRKFIRHQVAVIGIVTDIRRSRSGGRIVELEDRTGTMTIFIRKDDPAAGTLVNDDVIGVVGNFADKGDMFFANRVQYPEVLPTHQNRGGLDFDPVSVAFASDIHMGSKKFLEKDWDKMMKWMNSTDETAQNIKYFVLSGDVVDGVGVYPGHDRNLSMNDVYDQYEFCARKLDELPDHITPVILPGNHDAVRPAEPQPMLEPLIQQRFNSTVHTGNPARIYLNHGQESDPFEILSYHGKGIDDMVPRMAHVTYEAPAEAMKEMMKKRHLAPMWGERNALSPEVEDQMIIRDAPDLFVTGHTHAHQVEWYRGTPLVVSSTFQGETDFMQMLGYQPKKSLLSVYNLQSRSSRVISFES